MIARNRKFRIVYVTSILNFGEGRSYRTIQLDELELLQEHSAPPQIKPTITEAELI